MMKCLLGNLNILLLVSSGDVVYLALLSLLQNCKDRSTVVLHEDPVTKRSTAALLAEYGLEGLRTSDFEIEPCVRTLEVCHGVLQGQMIESSDAPRGSMLML
jgi:hypothetical protein